MFQPGHHAPSISGWFIPDLFLSVPAWTACTLFFRLLFFILWCFYVFQAGMYVFQLFDYYSASGMALLWVCCFECIAVAWIYGAGRYYDNIEYMIGFRINPWLRICWTAITPILTGVSHFGVRNSRSSCFHTCHGASLQGKCAAKKDRSVEMKTLWAKLKLAFPICLCKHPGMNGQQFHIEPLWR